MEKYISFEEFQKIFSELDAGAEYSTCDGIKLHQRGDAIVKDLQTWEVREDDCWILSYPKAGTTWAQEIMSAVMHDGNLEDVNKRHTRFRVPFLEMNLPESIRQKKNIPETHKVVEQTPSPRAIKSHLPGQFLPPQLWEKKPKIIYVIRNPKDLVVSYFYFAKLISKKNVDQPFEEFFNKMLTGKDIPYGPWWDHYLYFWKRRHEPNILLVRYEDMKRDLRGNVERSSKFLGKDLSPEILDAIRDHCTFVNMKENPMTNPHKVSISADNPKPIGNFMRKGIVGDWKSHFTVAQNEAMDVLIREKLRGTGLTFDYI